jgi:hypothetical protein
MFSKILRDWKPRVQNVIADANLLLAYQSDLEKVSKEEDRLHIQALYLDAFWNKYPDPKIAPSAVLQEVLRVIPTYKCLTGLNNVLFEAIDGKNKDLLAQLEQEEQIRKATEEAKAAEAKRIEEEQKEQARKRVEEKEKRRKQEEDNRLAKELKKQKDEEEKKLKELKAKQAQTEQEREFKEMLKRDYERSQQALAEQQDKRKLEAERQRAEAEERARLKREQQQKERKEDKPAEKLEKTKQETEEEKQLRLAQKKLKKEAKEQEKIAKEAQNQAAILAAAQRAAEEKRIEEQKQEEKQRELAAKQAKKLQEKKEEEEKREAERNRLKEQIKQAKIPVPKQPEQAPQQHLVIEGRRYSNKQLFNIAIASIAFVAVWGTAANYFLWKVFPTAPVPMPAGYTFAAGYAAMIVNKYMNRPVEISEVENAIKKITKKNQ